MHARQRLLFLYTFIGVSVVVLLNRQSIWGDSPSNEPFSRMKGLEIVTEHTNSLKTLNAEQFPLNSSISQPKVDIEVNGHSIRFNNNHDRRSPSFLNIHLVFHSHVDPGWLRTFEQYYSAQTHHIISNAVAALSKNPNLRFIWSETSFLERWWKDATDKEKMAIRKHVESGQLEISGGAWVMTDEATPTFYSAIENLVEGHAFIYEEFGIVPNTSWSVDPFGHGAMMPELMRLSGVENMVIGRFHDHIKEKLRERQSLKWRWTSPYSQTTEGPRVNSLPHLVYITGDACTVNAICMCYHVGPSALWQSQCIDGEIMGKSDNTTHLVERFVGEMKKVQTLYGSEHLLVPIGDDFFFGHPGDFKEMSEGFTTMIKYLEEHPELNAKMRFSTVAEFFDATKEEKLPLLRGDFFPYTSQMNNPNPWWTGYFVHRPYSKTMERRLQNSLRTLDLISVLKETSYPQWKTLRAAKRELALFQHHDGITGTSTRLVMEDYEKRMKVAFELWKELFLEAVGGNGASFSWDPATNKKQTIKIQDDKDIHLKIFSSATQKSRHLITIQTDRPTQVLQEDGKRISSNSFKKDGEFMTEFMADLNPLGMTTFKLRAGEPKTVALEKCLVLDHDKRIVGVMVNKKMHRLKVSLRSVSDSGGAYVLETRGDWTILEPGNVRQEEGLVEKIVYSDYGNNKGLQMMISCLENGELEVEMKTGNGQWGTMALAIDSDVANNGSFHTDVNGMYHLERHYQKTFDEQPLPIDANFFPVATSTFIEDSKKRLTVLTAQPTGATSQLSGQLLLLIDRIVNNDDGKGLGFNECFDNRSSTVRYRILVEPLSGTLTHPRPSHSLRGFESSSALLYPPIPVVSSSSSASSLPLPPSPWPCGVQLVSWRPLNQKTALLVLRRVVFESSISAYCEDNSPDQLFAFFSSRYSIFHHAKLSATVDGAKVTQESFADSLRQPFSIASFRLQV